MALHTPRTWTPGELVTATFMNEQIRDNENFLLGGKAVDGSNILSGTWTTTSTSFTDIHATLSSTISISSTRIGLSWSGAFSVTALGGVSNGTISVFLDGVDQGDASLGYITVLDGTIRYPSFFSIFTGLSVGSHTVKLRWKVSTALVTAQLGDNVGNAGTMTVFRVWEA